MLWLFKARCNRGHKQCAVVETKKQKSLNPSNMSESSGLLLGKCICSFQGKRCEIQLVLWKLLLLLQQLLQVPWCGVDMDSLLQVSTGDPACQSCLHQRGLRHGSSVTFLWEYLDLWVLHLGHWAWDTKLKQHMIFTFFAQYSPLMWMCPLPPSPFLTPPVCRWDTISLGRTQHKGFFCHVCFAA